MPNVASKPPTSTAAVTTQLRPRRRWRRVLIAGFVIGAYPMFVLGTTYGITLRSGLAGGRHGPCDAYRHSLASAIVAWTTSARFVEWVTAVMEGDDPGASHRMDAHNNRVGIRIAATAPDWSSLLRAVRAAVDTGSVSDAAGLADPDHIVWLPADRWRDRWW